jgi:signal peptidase I
LENWVKEARDWLIAVVFGFLLATVLYRNVLTPVEVQGRSMYPTLHNGDEVLQWSLFYQPSLFDVVIIEYSEAVYHVKRIVGMPGQHVKFQGDQLYIDGLPTLEPYLEATAEAVAVSNMPWQLGEEKFTADFALEEICGWPCRGLPEGDFLVLGDNRPVSQDSRQYGLVSSEQIRGRVNWVRWPLNRIGRVK